jgi:hypothetical protein
MPFEVRTEGDLFNTDLAETGIFLFMNIFNMSINISVVFTLYSTQSAGIAVLFVFCPAIYQTIVVFLETMLAFTSWNVVPFFMIIF